MEASSAPADGSAISVIVRAHNSRGHVDRALASLMAQSLQPREIILCEDASTDGTAAWVAAAWLDVRVVALPEHRGAAAAANAGLDAASGDVIAFLDADDEWDPRAL